MDLPQFGRMSRRRSIFVGMATTALVLVLIGAFSQYSPDQELSMLSSMGRLLMDQAHTHFHHKELFPLDSSDVWGTVAVTLGLLVAASGGIGGGGILVPLYILVFSFRPKYAVALSNFTIVGSSITNVVLNLSKRHPAADRPLVDWDLILVMEPLTMAGAIVGAFVSVLLPDWLLALSLVLLLGFTTQTTLSKGIQQYNAESKQFAAEAQSVLSQTLEEDEEDAESEGLLLKEHREEVQQASRLGEESNDLRNLLDEERSTPLDKVFIISMLVVGVVVLTLLRGGGSNFPSPLGVSCGGPGYWLLTLLVFVFILGVSVYTRGLLLAKWKRKRDLHFRYLAGDIEWNHNNTLLYPAICFFAGFSAGMFGIGGGVVKGPLMLFMGVNPLVASATCAVMILFTSLAGTTMYIALGTLQWDYGFFLFTLGLLATIVGQFGVSYLVNKYRRVSLVSLSIGAVVALSTVLMAVQAAVDLMYPGEEDAGGVCAE